MSERMNETQWTISIAKSVLHKSMRRADVEYAAYAAAWLIDHYERTVGSRKKGLAAAWRCVLAFPSEDLCGEGVERVAALNHCCREGHEADNLFAAIIHLCRLVDPSSVQLPVRESGQLNRWADELKNAAIVWVQGREGLHPRKMTVPDYALDHHCGFEKTTEKWWRQTNTLGPASPWREDAVRV
jgi:hypothetical protein